MQSKNLNNLVSSFIYFLLFHISIFNLNAHSQGIDRPENSWESRIGPFSSKFEIPIGWKDGSDANAKASNLYEREGMTSTINFSMNFGSEGLFIASWQNFKPTLSVEVAQLISEIPAFTGVKKSEVKISSEFTNNSNKFEYALFKGSGLGDNFIISGKGKIRYAGYWTHMPVQYKDSKGNLNSGMLSIFARVNESQANKLKIDFLINNFLSNLEFDPGFSKLSFQLHKDEVVKARVRKEIEAELSKAPAKNTQSETTNDSQQSSVTQPIIKDIYMVDNEGKCYRFIDKEGLKIASCPDHSAKPK